jgi:hypothetical protein
LTPPTVADGATRRAQPAAQGGVGYDPTLPDGGKQLLLGEHTVAVEDKNLDEIEDLGLDMHGLAGPSELPAAAIQFTIRKRYNHVAFRARRAEVRLSDFSRKNAAYLQDTKASLAQSARRGATSFLAWMQDRMDPRLQRRVQRYGWDKAAAHALSERAQHLFHERPSATKRTCRQPQPSCGAG